MAKSLSLDQQIKMTQGKLKALREKQANEKNKELIDFANGVKKVFEKYPKFTLKNFENWTKTNVVAVAKAMSIEPTTSAPTQNKPTTSAPTHH